LKDRGISEEISKEFELGLSLEGWDNLVKHFESKKIEAKESSKLFKIAKNERKYDVFRNRLIFPIISRRNKTVGFGGRVLDDSDQPKYLNTPESGVFKKSRELYGLPNVLARNSRPKQILVVEGYMDVLASFSFDLPIAVATLGIATNKFHLETLFQKTDEVIFCFDGDEAGKNASKLALDIAIPVIKDGKRAKFLFLPEKHDPASLLLEKGKDELPRLINDATNLSDYLFETILEKYDSSLEAKAAASKEFISLVKPMQEGNFKNILIKEFSKKMDVDLSEVSSTKQEAKKHVQPEDTQKELNKVTKSLIKCIVHNPELSKSEHLDYFLDNNEFLISPLISFLRAKSDVSFPMIIQEFPDQKNILIDLSNDQNLISPDEGLKFIKQAVEYIERNQGDNLLQKLKMKYETNELVSKEKIELKKLLTSKFEELSEDELSLFKKL
jgi:DNA primase